MKRVCLWPPAPLGQSPRDGKPLQPLPLSSRSGQPGPNTFRTASRAAEPVGILAGQQDSGRRRPIALRRRSPECRLRRLGSAELKLLDHAFYCLIRLDTDPTESREFND